MYAVIYKWVCSPTWGDILQWRSQHCTEALTQNTFHRTKWSSQFDIDVSSICHAVFCLNLDGQSSWPGVSREVIYVSSIAAVISLSLLKLAPVPRWWQCWSLVRPSDRWSDKLFLSQVSPNLLLCHKYTGYCDKSLQSMTPGQNNYFGSCSLQIWAVTCEVTKLIPGAKGFLKWNMI